MSRCYDCAEVEGYCTCIEQRVREHIAQEIESYTPFFATRKKMAEQGIEVDIFTRADKDGFEEAVEISNGVTVHHLVAGPVSKLSKEELPAHTAALNSAFMHHQEGKPNNYYDIIHSHYWISGQLGWMISEDRKSTRLNSHMSESRMPSSA